jgi:hypothetical protein
MAKAKKWLKMFGVTKPRYFRYTVQIEGSESTFTIHGATEEEARENHKANHPDEEDAYQHNLTVVSVTPRYALSVMMIYNNQPTDYQCNDIIEWRSFVRKNKDNIQGIFFVGGSELGNAYRFYEVVMKEYGIKWIKDRLQNRGKQK